MSPGVAEGADIIESGGGMSVIWQCGLESVHFYLERRVDTDEINEAWMLLKNAECEQKQKHTKGCNKEIILGKQWRIIELPEDKKKEYINKRRSYLLNVDLRKWNFSEATTKANPSIEN